MSAEDILSCFLCCSEADISTNENKLGNDLSVLESNLNAIFILRNLLQVPSSQLESYLIEDGRNPEKWITLCAQCTQLTRRAKELDQNIKRIEKELRIIQSQVLSKIRKSTSSNIISIDKKELAYHGDSKWKTGDKIKHFVINSKCVIFKY